MSPILNSILQFRSDRIKAGHSPDERHQMRMHPDDIALALRAVAAELICIPLGMSSPFYHPQIFGVELRTDIDSPRLVLK